MAVKRLLALVGVGLIVIGTLAATVVVSGPSPRVAVARTGAGIPLRTRAGGRGEASLDSTGPFVAYTLVLLNNTLIPGNFLAGNGLIPVAAAYDSGKGEVFVANLGTPPVAGLVSVISDATNAVVASVAVGAGPFAVAYDSGKGEGFVAKGGSNNVTVISDATNAVVATIRVGAVPFAVAYDGGKGEVFVANAGSNNVTVISDATNAVVANVPVGSSPQGVAYDGGKGEVFVTNVHSNNVSRSEEHTSELQSPCNLVCRLLLEKKKKKK